ncbi:MAG: class I tRNA ligase family protein [Planctomycetaceae bacterium]
MSTGRNFCNKFWNAARFAMMNLEGYTPGEVTSDDLQLEDRWVLSRLSRTASELTELLGRYQFDAATRTLRDFTWNEFCDWYLEMIKPRLRDEKLKPVAQRVLVGVLDSLIRLLQPFTPFICEELWQRLAEIAPERGLLNVEPAEMSVMQAAWPELPAEWIDGQLESRFSRLQEVIVAIRNVRAIYNIPPSTELKLMMRSEDLVAEDMQNVSGQFENLARAVLEGAGAAIERPPASASFALDDADGFIPLEGIVDLEEELKRQQKEADKLRGVITGIEKKLENKNFVDRAPEDVVSNVRETLAMRQKQLTSIEEIIKQLS